MPTRLIAVVGLFGLPLTHLTAAELVDAARAGDAQAVIGHLNEGGDPTEQDINGTTALHWAVYNEDPALVTALIAAGAAVDAANDYGSTPMSEAAVTGNLAIIRQLLEAGANVDSPNAEGQTALMVIARTSNTIAAELLIDHGADVNAREQWKDQTALMWAAAQSHPAMVALLLDHGADANARSKTHNWKRQVTAEPRAKHLPTGGLTPLLYAARQGCVDCTRALIEAGADIDLTDPDAITPLLMALLNARFDVAKLLIERGANINKWDWWGRTPLYAAVDYNTVPLGGRPDRPSLDQTTALEIIALLLDRGANPNAQLKLLQPFRNVGSDRGADAILGRGTTPLIRAAKAGDADAVRLLLEHGAFPELPQDQGVTPLMAATGLGSYSIDTRGRFRTEADAIDTTRIILEAGADPNQIDSLGQTAIFGAAIQGWNDVVRLMHEYGAQLDLRDHKGQTPADAALGRVGVRGRAGSDVNIHEDTAELIEALLAGE